MNVLLINGSPNANGCTYTALCEVAKGIAEYGAQSEHFHIGTSVAGCTACGACNDMPQCIIDGDSVNRAIEKLAQFDGLVLGAPVHFAGIAGNMKSFLDRFFYAADRSLLAYKPVAVVCSCRRGGATATFEQLLKYPTICNMPVVSSQYWNMVHGNTPAEVQQDLEGMQVMRVLGRNMGWLLQSIRAGQHANLPLPMPEDKVRTNFIR